MWKTSEKIIKHGYNEKGKPYTIRIEIPCFSDDETGKRINDFYHRLSDKMEQTAKKNGCTVIGELHRVYSGESIFSLYIDLLWYRERELLACRRISDTRTANNGLEVPLPLKLKKRLPKDGGWYYDGSNCVIYENKFTPGAEQGVRRSQYYKFFSETRFPMK